jgi:hypothetical protein
MSSAHLSPLVRLCLCIFLTLTMVGCGRPREGCDPKPEESNISNLEDANPTVIPTLQSPEMIQTIWDAGPHADTFVVSEDNTNSSCARCHAPLNWAPTKEDIPVSWVENQIDPATSSSYISNAEWKHVSCSSCHASEEAQRQGNFSWLEIPSLERYSDVETTTQLCQKCHFESPHPGHRALSIDGAHSELLCTDCHDSHDATATCAACHEPFAQECESIDTHDKPHSEVTCSACHDAGEPEIQWNEELLAWDTFRPDLMNDLDGYESYVSHNILLEVDCDRCHSPGDHPWDP